MNELRILRLHFKFHALEHMTRELAASSQSLHHLVQDRTLTLTITTTEDVHLTVQLPDDMFLTTP